MEYLLYLVDEMTRGASLDAMVTYMRLSFAPRQCVLAKITRTQRKDFLGRVTQIDSFTQPISIEEWDKAARLHPHMVRPFMMAAGDTRDGATLTADMEGDMVRLRISNLKLTVEGRDFLERLAALAGQKLAPLLAMVQGGFQGGVTHGAHAGAFAGSPPHGVAERDQRHDRVSSCGAAAWATGGAGHGLGVCGNVGGLGQGVEAGGGGAGGGAAGGFGGAAGLGGGSLRNVAAFEIGAATRHAALGEVKWPGAGSEAPFGSTAPGADHEGHVTTGCGASVSGEEDDDAMQIVAAYRAQQAAGATAQAADVAASFLRDDCVIPVDGPDACVGDSESWCNGDSENLFSSPPPLPGGTYEPGRPQVMGEAW